MSSSGYKEELSGVEKIEAHRDVLEDAATDDLPYAKVARWLLDAADDAQG